MTFQALLMLCLGKQMLETASAASLRGPYEPMDKPASLRAPEAPPAPKITPEEMQAAVAVQPLTRFCNTVCPVSYPVLQAMPSYRFGTVL